MGDFQELSFQKVVDTILNPEGIKVGGFPDDLFVDLSDEEREKWQCNICFLVSRDSKHCENKHIFCNTCIFAWSMTYGANSDKCPVCRIKQQEYASNRKIATEMSHKWVKCPEPGCALRCPLSDFLKHSHGIKLYGTTGDLSRVRRPRPPPISPPGIFIVPFLRSEGSNSMREGRNLLQDMMLVLHMEMELRRRAVERFHTDTDAEERRRHFNEIIAIQSQMQEITVFLDLLFRIPASRPPRAMAMNNFPGTSSAEAENNENSEDSSDSSSSEDSVIPRFRLMESIRRPSHSMQPNGNPVATGPSASSPSEPVVENRQTSGNNLTLSTGEQTRPGNLTRPTETNTGRLSSLRTVNQTLREQMTPQPNSIATVSNVETETISVLQTSLNAVPQLPPIHTSTSPSHTNEQLPALPRTNTLAAELSQEIQENSANTAQQPSEQPDDTVVSRRRPVPPAGQGARINTVRARRRTLTQPVHTEQGSSPSVGLTEPRHHNRPGQRPTNDRTNRDQTDGAAQQQSSLRAPGQNRVGRPTRHRSRTEGSLPHTSGALMRARRRSEIQQQLQEDTSHNKDPAGP